MGLIMFIVKINSYLNNVKMLGGIKSYKINQKTNIPTYWSVFGNKSVTSV